MRGGDRAFRSGRRPRLLIRSGVQSSHTVLTRAVEVHKENAFNSRLMEVQLGAEVSN